MHAVLPFVMIPLFKRAILIRLKRSDGRSGAALLATALLLALPWGGRGALAATAVETQGETSLRVTWMPDEQGYTIDTLDHGGTPWRTVRRLGAGRLTTPGRPGLPLDTYLIGVPRGNTLRVRVLEALFEDLPGPPVAPALADTLSRNGSEPVQKWMIDKAFYAASALYPERIAYTGKGGTLRYQDVVPVRIAPFQTAPSHGLLRRYTKIVLPVEFGPGRCGGAPVADPGPVPVRVLTVQGVAGHREVGQATVGRWGQRGKRPAFRVGQQWRIRAADLHAAMDARGERGS